MKKFQEAVKSALDYVAQIGGVPADQQLYEEFDSDLRGKLGLTQDSFLIELIQYVAGEISRSHEELSIEDAQSILDDFLKTDNQASNQAKTFPTYQPNAYERVGYVGEKKDLK